MLLHVTYGILTPCHTKHHQQRQDFKFRLSASKILKLLFCTRFQFHSFFLSPFLCLFPLSHPALIGIHLQCQKLFCVASVHIGNIYIHNGKTDQELSIEIWRNNINANPSSLPHFFVVSIENGNFSHYIKQHVTYQG